MSWTKATWQKGRRRVTGEWRYSWSADLFTVRLDSVDPVTGERRVIRDIGGDTPEWNGWKVIPKDEASCRSVVERVNLYRRIVGGAT